MKEAIRILTSEHRLILNQLDNLVLARRSFEKGQWPPRRFFTEAIDFAANFADRFHHFKEEFIMFGLLAQKKEGRLDTEIGALRYQHECCRNAMADIEKSLKTYATGDEIAATALLTNLAVYTALLRRHIFLEDHVFFPMVDRVLSEEDADSMLAVFAEQEGDAQGGNFVARYRKKVDQMRTLLES